MTHAIDNTHRDWITQAMFLPTMDKDATKKFISIGRDGCFRLFDFHKPTNCQEFKENIGPLNVFAVSPDGSLAAFGSKEGKVSIWQLTDSDDKENVSRQAEIDMGAPVNELLFHNDRFMLFAGHDEGISVIELSQ